MTDVYISQELQLYMPDDLILTDEEKSRLVNSDLIPLKAYRGGVMAVIGNAIVIDGTVNAIINGDMSPEIAGLFAGERKPPCFSFSAYLDKDKNLVAILLTPEPSVPAS